jgi:alkane 1-monooxygenase
MSRQTDPMLAGPVRTIALLVNFAVQLLPLWLMYTTGQVWPLLITFGFFFGFVPLFDLISGDCREHDVDKLDDRLFAVLQYAQATLLFATFVVSIVVAASGKLPIWGSCLAVMLIGILNVQCPVVAHEFGHKLGRWSRTVSNFICSIVGMGYFMPQHVMGHHVKVATPEDCATARFGDTAFGFVVKSFPAEVHGGVTLEAARLRRRGQSVWSLHNDVIVSYGMSAIVAVVLALILGWQALLFILLHHTAAWFTLMLNDYVQHYGLMREMMPNGRREPAGPQHSWNTDTPLTNLLVLNVQRHSHHHEAPMLPYQYLRDMPDAPRLPTGYFGMMQIALVPPLWFRLMDPRVVAVADGRRERINVGRHGNARLDRLIARYRREPAGLAPVADRVRPPA